MIPQNGDDLRRSFQIVSLPTRTPELHREGERVYGLTDGRAAMEQAIYLMLSVERYEWLIHSWNYGVELRDLFGQPVNYCVPEIQRRITEALIQDDRISAVDNFQFETVGGRVHVTFTAHTSFGEVEGERTVDI